MKKYLLILLLILSSLGGFSQTKLRLTQIEDITNAGIKSMGVTANKVLTSNNSTSSIWAFPSWTDLLNKPTTVAGYGLPAYPTTLPASDVYAWAKAVTKPSYIYSDIGGTIPTWNQSTTGNAATATNSTQWNGQFYLNTATIASPAYVMMLDGSDSQWKAGNSATVKTWLGLGSNAYNSTAYLPLAGGTLTGALYGTTANFSGSVTSNTFSSSQPANTGNWLLRANNASAYMGVYWDGSGVGEYHAPTSFKIYTANGIRGNFDANGLITYGSGTFSGSVTANGLISTGNIGFQNDVYYPGAVNPIWNFRNAPGFGLSYYEGTALSVGSAIGFHFGNAAAPVATISLTGNITAGGFTSTSFSSGVSVINPAGSFARLSSLGIANVVHHAVLSVNGKVNPNTNGWIQDNASVPSWMIVLNATDDILQIKRGAAGVTSASNMDEKFVLSNTGAATFTGGVTATGGVSIIEGNLKITRYNVSSNTVSNEIQFDNGYNGYQMARIVVGSKANWYDTYIAFKTNIPGYAGTLEEYGRFDSNGLTVNGAATFSGSVSTPFVGISGPTLSYGRLSIINTSTTGESSIHVRRSNQTQDAGWTFGQGVASIGDSFGFYTSGAVRLSLTTGGNATFSGSVTATNFILSSDRRLKKNIKTITSIAKPRWVNFEMKADSTHRQRAGVIAQELEKTNPEFVYTDEKGMKSVAYIDLLITKIAELENRIKTLENEK